MIKDTYIRDNLAQGYTFTEHYPLNTLGGDGGPKGKISHARMERGNGKSGRIETEQRRE